METKKVFFDRFRYLYTPHNLMILDLAYSLSKFAHRHDVRSSERDLLGNPVRYFEHPRAVALILFDEMGICDLEVMCTALLHDVLEDTDTLSFEQIEHVFGHSVAQALIQLTKTSANKSGYYARLQRFGTREAILVKIADRIHNLRTLGTDPEFIRKQREDTRLNFPKIVERLWEVGSFTSKERDAINNLVLHMLPQ